MIKPWPGKLRVRTKREDERFRLPICLAPGSGPDDKYTFLPRPSAAADRGNGQVP